MQTIMLRIDFCERVTIKVVERKTESIRENYYFFASMFMLLHIYMIAVLKRAFASYLPVPLTGVMLEYYLKPIMIIMICVCIGKKSQRICPNN